MQKVTLVFITALLATGLFVSGCSSVPKAEEKSAAQDAAKQYPMTGEILGLDAEQHVATIRHEEIKGFMAAMTMGYPVKDQAEFGKLAVGDRISATVYVGGDDMYVGNIQKTPKSDAPAEKK